MPETTTSWFRPLKKVLLGISMLAGLYLFAFQVSRLVVSSLFMGIESSRATGLSAIAPVAFHALPAYQSADGLLQAGGINVVRALSLAIEVSHFEATALRRCFCPVTKPSWAELRISR